MSLKPLMRHKSKLEITDFIHCVCAFHIREDEFKESTSELKKADEDLTPEVCDKY